MRNNYLLKSDPITSIAIFIKLNNKSCLKHMTTKSMGYKIHKNSNNDKCLLIEITFKKKNTVYY